MTLEYKTTEYDENKSVKAILQKHFQISNRLMTKLKLNKKILVDGMNAWVNEVPPLGALIQVYIDFEEADDTIPQDGILEVLYEDEYFLAVNKPANMVVHPCSYHPDNTLANYVKAYLNCKRKIRPINRLDNGTSGVVLFAKNEYIQERFKNLKPKAEKEYFAIAYGVFENKKDTISLPIARKGDSLIEREVNFELGQESITHYEVIGEGTYNGKKISFLKILLDTGRTHQIRVHMSYLGHPLIGDSLYGEEAGNREVNNIEAEGGENINRQALHASSLSFIHPITQENIKIVAPLPDDILNIKMRNK